MRPEIAVIAGRSNRVLAAEAAAVSGVALIDCDVWSHADGELGIEIRDNVRGMDVFVVQSTSTPVNDHLMELLVILDALKRASAKRVTAVIPYFGYARQDRKSRPRQPITAKLVADLLGAAGCSRILTMDLHSGQIMGFFDIPVDNLYARPVFLPYLREHFVHEIDSGANAGRSIGENICIVSPDAGGVGRARGFARRLQGSLAIIDKRRTAPGQIAEMNVIGDVRGKTAIIVDDMVDTGGTLGMAVTALKAHGAERVVACATHAVLSGDAFTTLTRSGLERLIVSDTISQKSEESSTGDFVVRLSVAPIIGEAMRRIHDESSVSSLFEVE